MTAVQFRLPTECSSLQPDAPQRGISFAGCDAIKQRFIFAGAGSLADIDRDEAVTMALQILSIATTFGRLDPVHRAALDQIVTADDFERELSPFAA